MAMVFIGQAPSRETDGLPPFVGKCGGILARMMGIPQSEMLARFRFMNLLERFPGKAKGGDAFPIDQARIKAFELLCSLKKGDEVVLLGRNVAKAFFMEGYEYLFWHHQAHLLFLPTAIVPHPSGVNHWYNDPGNKARAIEFLQEIERRNHGRFQHSSVVHVEEEDRIRD